MFWCLRAPSLKVLCFHLKILCDSNLSDTNDVKILSTWEMIDNGHWNKDGNFKKHTHIQSADNADWWHLWCEKHTLCTNGGRLLCLPASPWRMCQGLIESGVELQGVVLLQRVWLMDEWPSWLSSQHTNALSQLALALSCQLHSCAALENTTNAQIIRY